MELSAITDIHVRHGFIRKVFAILAVQLIATTVIAGLTCQAFAGVDQRNPPASMTILQALSLCASIGTIGVLMCCPNVMREFPRNYIVLGIFTLGEAVLVGIVCSQYTAQSVLVAFGLTAFVVTALMLFACQTKYDFTGLAPYFYIALLILTGMSLVFCFASMFGASQTGAFKQDPEHRVGNPEESVLALCWIWRIPVFRIHCPGHSAHYWREECANADWH